MQVLVSMSVYPVPLETDVIIRELNFLLDYPDIWQNVSLQCVTITITDKICQILVTVFIIYIVSYANIWVYIISSTFVWSITTIPNLSTPKVNFLKQSKR